MPDTVIVTIKYPGCSDVDFELPAKSPFTSWKESLKLAAEKSFYHINNCNNKDIILKWQGKAIPQDASLQECGIYDGEILELQII